MADRFSTRLLGCILAFSTLISWGSKSLGDFNAPGEDQLRVLSYQDMMNLPEKSRALYIKSLRLFMAAEEAKHPGSYDIAYFPGGASPSVASLFFSQAEAQDTSAKWDPNLEKYLNMKTICNVNCHQTPAEIAAAQRRHDDESASSITGILAWLKKCQQAPPFTCQDWPTYPADNSKGAATATDKNQSAASLTVAGGNSSSVKKADVQTAPAKPSAGIPKPQVRSQDVVSSVKRDQKSNDQQIPCYIAGNRTIRTNGVCRLGLMEDENARALTKECGTDKVACNEFIFGLPKVCESVSRDISRNGNITNNCDKDAPDPKAVANQMKNWSNKQIKAWNDYKDKLNEFCNSTNKTAECKVLQKRLQVIVDNAGPLPYTKLICKGYNASTGKNTYLIGHSADPKVADPGNKDVSQLTDLQYMTDASKKDKEAACGTDKECYSAVDKVQDSQISVTGGVQNGKVKAQSKQDGKSVDGDVSSSDKGECLTNFKPAAIEPLKPVCEAGTLFCAAHQINPDRKSEHKSKMLYVDNGQGFKMADDKATLDVKKKNKDRRNTEALDNDLKAMERDSESDEADLVRWGKESSDKKPKSAIATVVNPDKITEDLSVSKSPQFIQAVTENLGQIRGTCLSSWIRITQPSPSWEGAKWTDYYACGTEKGDNKIDKIGGPYVKIHRDRENGGIVRVEVGTLDKFGRPLTTDIYKDGYIEPYISVAKPKKGDHWFGRDYAATINPEPLKDHRNPQPYLKIVKSGDKYVACRAEEPPGKFEVWNVNLTENKGVLSGKDSQNTYFEFSKDSKLSKEGVAMCDVAKKPVGAKEMLVSSSVEPYSAGASASPQKGSDGKGNADTPTAPAPRQPILE